jgi:hypothetical protein
MVSHSLYQPQEAYSTMSQELRNNYLFTLLSEDDRRTRVVSTLLAKFAEAAKAVREIGKDGEVVLKIKISKDKNDEEALGFLYTVTAKVPELAGKSSIGFYDEKTKTVIKTDPRQLELMAEKEDERLAKLERDRHLTEQGIAKIGRGETATA